MKVEWQSIHTMNHASPLDKKKKNPTKPRFVSMSLVKGASFSHLIVLFRRTPLPPQFANNVSQNLKSLPKALWEKCHRPQRASQFPGASPVKSALHYILPTHTHASVFTLPLLCISPLDFLSLNIFGRGAVRHCSVRSVSLVCRRHIPHIILPLNVSDSQSQAPIAIDLPRLWEKSRKLGETTTLQLSAQSIQYLGIRKWRVASSPIPKVILKPWLPLQERLFYQWGIKKSLTKLRQVQRWGTGSYIYSTTCI